MNAKIAKAAQNTQRKTNKFSATFAKPLRPLRSKVFLICMQIGPQRLPDKREQLWF
ncbi:MAG: hypothetical protein KA914_16650 [Ottowia sp.]|nr:hypothetical protein [Ottowia sp.]